MKYTLLALTLLSACHGFAMQQQTHTPTPASTSATTSTPLLQKASTHSSSSVIIAMTNGVAPTNLLKKIFYERFFGQQQ